jgi:Tol biopolymer transport system component
MNDNLLTEFMKTKIKISAISALAALAGFSLIAQPKYSNWSEPVNLGPVINSPYNDQHPALSKDGLSLYITSNRPGGQGADDIWVSQRASVDDAWGPPQNLGPIINTASFEGAPALSSDGETLLFYSDRTGGFGGNDLYMTTRHKLSGKDAGPAASTTQ